MAEDYYAAMSRVEEKLAPHLHQTTTPQPAENNGNPDAIGNTAHLRTLVAALQAEPLTASQQTLVTELARSLSGSADMRNAVPKQSDSIINEQEMQPTEVWAIV